MRTLQIDHVTIAASRLERLEAAFADSGLRCNYGGMHSNGVTHMSLLGFDDGSYVELISTERLGQSAPWWPVHISRDAGPCAWAVGVDDITAEVERLKGLGVAVSDAAYCYRNRPNAQRVEWDLAVVGHGELGTLYPFIIKDRTPREWRVSPGLSVANSELTSVARVIIGVQDLEQTCQEFCRIYGFSRPTLGSSTHLGARLAVFPGQPVALATPLNARSALAERLEQFGDCPCAVLIGSQDMNQSRERFDLTDQERWPGHPLVGWFAAPALARCGLGIATFVKATGAH